MTRIKQLADELGVTKQAVRKQVSKLPSTMISTGNNREILINDDGCKIIMEVMSTKTPLITANQGPTVDTLVGILQQELDAKNAQLAEKDKQIGELTAALQNTTASLHAAQALHAGTMQKKITSPEPSPEEAGKKPGFFARWFRNR